MPICHEKKLIFVHISKNAGTSVRDLLSNYNTDFNEGYFFDDPTWRFYQLFYNKEWKEYTSFCIIRDPIERFISNYNYAQKEYRVKHIDYFKCKNFEINELIDMVYYNRIKLKSYHWKPQYSWICDDSMKIRVDKIIKIENLEEELKKMNLTKPLKKLNYSEKKSNIKLNKFSKEKLFELYKKDYELLSI